MEEFPGADVFGEKGKRYAEEQHPPRGTGGNGQYNPGRETRAWNEEAALRLSCRKA